MPFLSPYGSVFDFVNPSSNFLYFTILPNDCQVRGKINPYFLDENFTEEILRIVADVKSDEYYINMMISWFFATALAKQYDCTVKYIEDEKLSRWVHNNTIRKAVESNRISSDIKKYLRTLKKLP